MKGLEKNAIVIDKKGNLNIIKKEDIDYANIIMSFSPIGLDEEIKKRGKLEIENEFRLKLYNKNKKLNDIIKSVLPNLTMIRGRHAYPIYYVSDPGLIIQLYYAWSGMQERPIPVKLPKKKLIELCMTGQVDDLILTFDKKYAGLKDWY